MQSTSLARNAGMIGLAGALLWVVSTVMAFSLGLTTPSHDALYVVNQIMFTVAMLGITIGILGLLWAGAVQGLFGKIAVGLFALAYAVLVLANPIALVTNNPDLFLFPIGGLLSLVAAILTGIAVAAEKRWSGWQRFMPLVHAVYVFLALYLPLFVANQTPGLLSQLFWGVSFGLMSLAVVTSPRVAPAAQVRTA